MQQPTTWAAALIGDMVASRKAADRPGLQRAMETVFATVDGVVGGRPTFTIGDEFQARYPTLGEAIEASIQLHLRGLGLTRLRIGIGWGELLTEDPERSPYGQDGPCWWNARDAIETVDRASKLRTQGLRTAVRTESYLDSLLNSYLMLRDTVLSGLDEVDARIAVGLLDGFNQTELAARFGLNKSSVSRRANTHGILALIEARSIWVPTIPIRS
jgi:hypothetical protein